MRILIVEDDGGSRAILEEHLQARQWHVECATSVPEADRLLATGAFDLVLSDIHLPGADGTAHIRRFCGRGGPVVVMTGFPTLESCLDSIQHGAAAYLVKPFRVSEFVSIAERIHQHRGEQARVAQLEERVRELELELARWRGASEGTTRGERQVDA